MSRFLTTLAIVWVAAVVQSAAWAFAPESATPRLSPGQGIPGGLDGRGLGLPQDGLSTGPIAPDPLNEDLPALPDDWLDGDGIPDHGADVSPPPVTYGEAALPEPVRRTRSEIVAAARSGDPEALRPLIERTDPPPMFASMPDTDPVDVLRAQSGDEAGREILAIMLDVLDAGWVRLDEGTERERFVWPYFVAYDPESLDSRQQVELLRILTAGDFDEMRAAGAYVFYRLEITPDGRWQAFVAGE